ncbi:MAG: hypothetical protein J6S85_15200 [Methanobrevibacter sp.]|nr:hypothetical protein [Methanobrevibacter sp.]
MLKTFEDILAVFPWERFQNASSYEDTVNIGNEIRKELLPQCEGPIKEIVEKELEGEFNLSSFIGEKEKQKMGQWIEDHYDEVDHLFQNSDTEVHNQIEKGKWYEVALVVKHLILKLRDLGMFKILSEAGL